MPTYIDTTNLSPATIAQLQGPVITQIQITNSSYTVIDDTAVSTSGGYIKITGSNFTAGTQVVIGTAAATSVTFVNSTTLNVQVPAQSAGSYVVYVTINTGSVAIMVNGVTYSGVPTWVTGSTLPGGQVDTAISIQLSATGDAPLTYVLAAGSSLPPGITLTSGGLLSGAVTGITDETVYNFTINAIDAEAQDSPRGFTITITSNDQYFDLVTALFSAAAPTSTFISDASTNAVEFTIVGDTRPNNVNPFTPGYYSNFFDGTGDYLTVPDNTAFNLSSGSWTIECWAYLTGGSGYRTFISKRTGATSQWELGIDPSSYLYFYTSSVYASSTVVSNNVWTHCAASYDGTNLRLFVNGVVVLTQAGVTAAAGSDPVFIGQCNAASQPVTGCLSNLRVVKGTALYTGAFTPSTTPLTAVANTSLLTCQSNRFIDNSANNFTVTRNGNVAISHFNPFLPNSSYSSYGCGYFDGSDRISTPNISAFDLSGSSPFTIEAWIYPTATNSYLGIYGARADGQLQGWCLYVSNNNTLYMGSVIVGQSYADRQMNTTPIIPNAWTHVALVKETTFYKAYVNGVGGAALNLSGGLQYQSGQPLVIGALGSQGEYPFTGGITNARIVKGTAVYTSDFTPSNTPFTAIANTQLLTLQSRQSSNNIAFVDNSNLNALLTRYGNPYQGSFSPYGGGWSNYFDGSGDYLVIPYNVSLVQWWDTNYTIEMWVYNRANAASGSVPLQVAHGIPTASDTYWAFGTNAAGNLSWYYWNGSGNYAVSTSTVPLNIWTHVAMVYNNTSSILKGYINGVEAFSVSKSGTPQSSASNTLNIGKVQNVDYTGYISNLRIVRGTMVYTGAFTPPAAPLTPIANTQLLTCADNRFIDDSANNFTVTRNGDTSIQRFNPFNPVVTTPTSYSGYFDGTGDYLTVPANTAFAFGTGDFTVEAWVYPFIRNATYGSQIAGPHVYGVSADWHFMINTTGNLYFQIGSTATGAQTSTSTVPLNAWTHVVVVRASGNMTFYINGVAAGTGSYATSITNASTALGIGAASNGNAASTLTGYISNLRIVKGTAVYTSAFTPPTAPLTAIANTSLLTCQSPTFIDNSTNNFTITNNGDTAPRQFNPFGWTSTTGASAAYTPALYSGSAYFDGSGDFIYSPPLSNWNFASRNFTVEGWFYFDNGGANVMAPLYTNYEAYTSGNGSIFWGKHTSASGYVSLWLSNYSTGGPLLSESTMPPSKAWTHYALVRNGNTFTIYRNGVATVSSTAFTGAATNGDQPLYIATNGDGETVFFSGFISDFRIINGTALYTGNFQPPVAPLTLTSSTVNNTVLLCNMTGAGIYDSAMIENWNTIGLANISTSQKKYGSSSMSFVRTTQSYLLNPNSSRIYSFGTGDFTMECWVYLNAMPAANDYPNGFYVWGGGPTNADAGFDYYIGSTQIRVNLAVYSSPNIAVAHNMTTAVWYHLALVRSGSTLYLFRDGVQLATANVSGVTADPSITGVVISAAEPAGSTGGNFNGYIDDFRITRGFARYTSGFTPPTGPVIRF